MARETMEANIAEVRRMIGDSATPPQFTDDAIESTLDRWRFDVSGHQLTPIISRDAEGDEVRLTYQSTVRPWEVGAQLTHGGELLTVDEADEARGRWTFATDTDETVEATGSFFDANAAAAELCDEWAAHVAREYTFSGPAGSFNRADKRAGLEAAAAAFRRKAMVTYGTLTRSDELHAPAVIDPDRFA